MTQNIIEQTSVKNNNYDLIVIGAGAGGLTASGFAGQIGAKVALIEREYLGGDCTWTGCIPSKALIKVANTAHTVRTANKYGVMTTDPTVDMTKVREYIQQTIQEIYQHETPEEFSKRGVDIILGEAQFIDANTIEINNQRLHAKKFVIATGAKPLLPSIKGLTDVPFMTNRDIFDNDVLPDRMLVIGAGPIGMEMAQAYARLGSQITLVDIQMLPCDEPEAQDVIKQVFAREGIRFIESLVFELVQDDDEIVATLQNGAEVRVDMVFVATGRNPNVDSVGLDNAGVSYSEMGIKVDKFLRTNQNHIYAVGDCIGAPYFTHNASYQGAQAARNALIPGNTVGILDTLPWVTFTSPEIAHAGMTEVEAREKYGDSVKTFMFHNKQGDRTVTEDDVDGFIKLVYKGSGKLLGATIVSERAGEMITELIIAMKFNISPMKLTLAIHPYPTYSEVVQKAMLEVVVKELFDGFSGKVINSLSKVLYS